MIADDGLQPRGERTVEFRLRRVGEVAEVDAATPDRARGRLDDGNERPTPFV
jgi:hypothetical protein